MTDVPDDADDLAPAFAVVEQTQPFADRAGGHAARQVLPNELIIDDRDVRRARAIGGRERPAGEQRDSEGPVIARRHPLRERERRRAAWFRGLSTDRERRVVA